MNLFDECRSLSSRIQETQETIEQLTLAASAPKGQSFDDSPKQSQGRFGNSIEDYIERKEELECRVKELQEMLDSKWSTLYSMMKSFGNSISAREMMLMYYRFHEGLSWRQCSYNMNWSDNKSYAVYRKVTEMFNEM